MDNNKQELSDLEASLAAKEDIECITICWGDVNLATIGEYLKDDACKLVSLSLVNNNIVDYTPLIEGLKTNRTLVHLNIRNNPDTNEERCCELLNVAYESALQSLHVDFPKKFCICKSGGRKRRKLSMLVNNRRNCCKKWYRHDK